MMKQKRKMPIEKHVKKKLMSKAKESQKMLQQMKMDSNEFKWAKGTSLESLFNLQWTTPKEDLLWDFLRTQEVIEDGKILGEVCGQEIFIDQVLIHEQLGISKEGIIDAANAIFEEAKIALKRIIRPHAFVENEQWSVVHMKEKFHARFATIL